MRTNPFVKTKITQSLPSQRPPQFPQNCIHNYELRITNYEFKKSLPNVKLTFSILRIVCPTHSRPFRFFELSAQRKVDLFEFSNSLPNAKSTFSNLRIVCPTQSRPFRIFELSAQRKVDLLFAFANSIPHSAFRIPH